MAERETQAPDMPDLETVYDNEVSPKIRELLNYCADRGLPVVVMTQFAEGGVATSGWTPEGCDKRLPMVQMLARASVATMVAVPGPGPDPEGSVKH